MECPETIKWMCEVHSSLGLRPSWTHGLTDGSQESYIGSKVGVQLRIRQQQTVIQFTWKYITDIPFLEFSYSKRFLQNVLLPNDGADISCQIALLMTISCEGSHDKSWGPNWDYSFQTLSRLCLKTWVVDGCMHKRWADRHMMTSSNGKIFRVTGHLCGEFTGPLWITHTKASDVELWCLFDLRLNKNKSLSKQSWGWWFETLSCPLWRHCNEMTPKHIQQNVMLDRLGKISLMILNLKTEIQWNQVCFGCQSYYYKIWTYTCMTFHQYKAKMFLI